MFDRQTDKGTNLPLQDRMCIMHRGKKNCTELVMHITEYQVMSQHRTGGIEDCDTVAAEKNECYHALVVMLASMACCNVGLLSSDSASDNKDMYST